MAFTLSRIDRKSRTYDLSATVLAEAAAIPPDLTGVDVALLPPRGAPTAATVWYSADYADGSFTVLLAGPDADSTGALVVPASADIWMRIADAPEVDAEKLERIIVLGGGGVIAAPTGVPVITVNGHQGGTITLDADDVGAQSAATLGTDVVGNATVKAALVGTGTSAFADFAAKADANLTDLHLLVISDSTAAAAGGWVDQAVPLLAARFPRHSISHAKWTDGSPGSYAAPTVTAGSGARTINIWNASVAGMTWQYHFDVTRWPTMIAAIQPDAVYVSLGHNDNPAAVQSGNVTRQRGKALGYLEFLRTLCPSARLVLGSQNPLINYANASQLRGEMLRALAQARGYGYVDVAKAFIDDGRDLATVLVSGDQTHPTTAGYAVWAARFMQEFAAGPTGRVPAQLLPLFAQQGTNLVPDPTFAAYNGTVIPTGWGLTNLTHARTTTAGQFESGSGAIALTKAAGGSIAFASANLPLALVKGRTVTAIARIYMASGSGNMQVGVGDNTGIGGSETWTQDGQFHWRLITNKISATATSASIRLTVDASTGGTLTTAIIDRVGVFIGDLPFDPEPSRTNPSLASGPDVQIFTTSGTWTQPVGASKVDVMLLGAGGGGGSGARQVSGSACSGGAGGGGGGYSFRSFPATTLGSTESIGVGVGGVGGAAVTTDTTAGTSGGNGGVATFGTHLRAAAGVGGAGGALNAASTAGASGSGSNSGGAGGGGANGAVGGTAAGNIGGATGGGAGGGISTTPAAFAGGGSPSPVTANMTVITGAAIGAAGSTGTNVNVGEPAPGVGGAGGGSSIAGTGGAGGVGGRYGAGGGGGGSSLNGNASGAGGDGSPGIVVVIST